MDAPRERFRESVAAAEDYYEDGGQRARELAETASDRSKQALNMTDEWVHENPWTAIGIVAGIGLLAGILLGQGSRSDDWDPGI